MLKIHDLSGTEIPYHGECWDARQAHDQVLTELVHDENPAPLVFTRPYRVAQFRNGHN